MITTQTIQEITLQSIRTEVANLRDKVMAMRKKTLEDAKRAQLPDNETDAILESMEEAYWKLYGLSNEIKAMCDAIHDSH